MRSHGEINVVARQLEETILKEIGVVLFQNLTY